MLQLLETLLPLWQPDHEDPQPSGVVRFCTGELAEEVHLLRRLHGAILHRSSIARRQPMLFKPSPHACMELINLREDA